MEQPSSPDQSISSLQLKSLLLFDSTCAIVLYHGQGDAVVFKIDFYSNHRGEAPVLIFLEELRSSSTRDRQIQYRPPLISWNPGAPSLESLSPNILKMVFGNSVQAAIAFCISSSKTGPLFFFMHSERELGKHLDPRSKKRRRNALIGSPDLHSSAISHSFFHTVEH